MKTVPTSTLTTTGDLKVAKPNRTTTAQWLERLGSRDALLDMAMLPARSPAHDRKRRRLVELLEDPGTADLSLMKLVDMAGIGGQEVLSLMRDAARDSGQALAQMVAGQAAPQVVDEIAAAAVRGTQPCPCVYTPEGPVGPPFPACRTCAGRGYVYHDACLDSAKLLLEIAGVTQKGGGPTVNVQTNVATGLGGNFFESFVKSTDSVALAPAGEVVDATPVDE